MDSQISFLQIQFLAPIGAQEMLMFVCVFVCLFVRPSGSNLSSRSLERFNLF